MRLLNSHTLKLEIFEDDRQTPPYAILSHTWGNDEVTFEDMQTGRENHESQGYWKISQCANQARKDGHNYIWVDTCMWKINRTDCVFVNHHLSDLGCIQKTSSAELSEAINSMFR